jgi:hypothetical protein
MVKLTPSLNAMAKNAKSKKPSAPKKAQKSHPQQKALSTEYVEDDEDESAADSDSDSDSLPKIPSEQASKPNGKPPALEGISSSSENESGSEESSEESTAEENDKGNREPKLQRSKVTK